MLRSLLIFKQRKHLHRPGFLGGFSGKFRQGILFLILIIVGVLKSA